MKRITENLNEGPIFSLRKNKQFIRSPCSLPVGRTPRRAYDSRVNGARNVGPK